VFAVNKYLNVRSHYVFLYIIPRLGYKYLKKLQSTKMKVWIELCHIC